MRDDELLLNQFMVLLAGTGLSDDQISRVLRHLKGRSTSSVLEQVDFYRRAFLDSSVGEVYLSPPEPSSNRHAAHLDREALGSVERLLVIEAGLPKSVAAQIISEALRARNPAISIPEFNSKDGFSRWLRQVSEMVPLGELLHVAASIRNHYVHTSSDDWIKNKK